MTALVCILFILAAFGWLTAAVLDAAYMDERANRLVAEACLRAEREDRANAYGAKLPALKDRR